MLSSILRAWQQKKVTLEKLSKYNGKKEGVKNVLIHVSVRVEMKEGWDCAVSHLLSGKKFSKRNTEGQSKSTLYVNGMKEGVCQTFSAKHPLLPCLSVSPPPTGVIVSLCWSSACA